MFVSARPARVFSWLILAALGWAASVASAEDNPYYAALRQAKASHRPCLLLFAPTGQDAAWTAFDQGAMRHPHIAARLAEWEVARLTIDQTYLDGDSSRRLLEHPAFKYLRNGPGLAVVEYRDPKATEFEQVVSLIPWEADRPLTPRDLAVLLDLPAGSLTQRTLIYAVRTHPEQPASTVGRFHPILAEEAAKHAVHQAAIWRQGHHQWDQRFHAINARLGEGLIAQEVCAESWPNEDLFAAARDCVDSWRQSSGHWSAVSGQQTLFAYDMARGTNGIWYAVGLFAK